MDKDAWGWIYGLGTAVCLLSEPQGYGYSVRAPSTWGLPFSLDETNVYVQSP